jgi:hypothetical protein
LPNDAGALAERMRTHRGKCRVDLFGWHDHDDLAFVAEIERIKSEDFAECLDLFANRSSGLLDRDLRRIGDLVQDRREPRRG